MKSVVKVFLNGQELTFSKDEFGNLGELYERVAPKGMVLKTISIDNEQVEPQKLSERLSEPLHEGETITMEFATPQEYLEEMLPSILRYIDTVINLLPNVAAKVRELEPSAFKDIEDLSNAISALDDLRQSVLAIVPMEMDDNSEVVAKLRNFLKALERQDMSAIANCLEQEIPQVMTFYSNLFQRALLKLREAKTP